MPKLILFYLPACPYCKMALRALERLRGQQRYAKVAVELVDESRQRELADSYDYWNVPCFFLGDRKLFEARPGQSEGEIEEGVRAALEAAL